MNIGILGTGGVGQTIAAKLSSLGHSVTLGTRDAAATLSREEFSSWHVQNSSVKIGSFAEAAAHGEIIVNALSGQAVLETLKAVGEANLSGKILIDISNPLDFSKGMPPSLFVGNTDSLGEQIQRAFPGVKVVKTLNTVTAHLMVNPVALADGDHHLFMSGDDADAKATVIGYLREWFGWKNIVDLGGINTARATEAVLHVWIQLWGKLGTAHFNFKIVQ
jgi:hypothetical protein